MIFNDNFKTLKKSSKETLDPELNRLCPSTLGLFNCSIEDAIRYGGELTRAAIGAMSLRNDRKRIVVDTKIHMLKPGMLPCIPGWHTDAAPRDAYNNPAGSGPPDIWKQNDINVEQRAPRMHLLVTGGGCLTEFTDRPVDLRLERAMGTKLYQFVTQQVEQLRESKMVEAVPVKPNTAYEFTWWHLHRGVQALVSEWRFFIRVTETDFQEPVTDPAKFIRTQQQAYLPLEFGW